MAARRWLAGGAGLAVAGRIWPASRGWLLAGAGWPLADAAWPRFLWKRHGSRRFRFKGRGGEGEREGNVDVSGGRRRAGPPRAAPPMEVPGEREIGARRRICTINLRSRPSVPAEVGRAMFLLRYEGEQKPNTEQMDNHAGNSIYKNLLTERYNQKAGRINWSWSNSGVGGEQRKGGRKTTYSSSSISSASSASTWSVMEWVSPEEAQLRRMQGISLLVYAWKN